MADFGVGPVNNPLYKKNMCCNYLQYGKCSYGKLCQFAHSKEEMDEWNEWRRVKKEFLRRAKKTKREKKKANSEKKNDENSVKHEDVCITNESFVSVLKVDRIVTNMWQVLNAPVLVTL